MDSFMKKPCLDCKECFKNQDQITSLEKLYVLKNEIQYNEFNSHKEPNNDIGDEMDQSKKKKITIVSENTILGQWVI